MDIEQVRNALELDIERVVYHLLPNGKQDGKEWLAGNTNGDVGKSLRVNMNGKAGVWSDFATGEGGDVLGLWQAVRGCDFKQALDEAAAFVGVLGTQPQKSKPKTTPKQERVQANPPQGIDGVTRFTYTDANTNPVIYVTRKDEANGKKSFYQWGRSADDTGWVCGLGNFSGLRPLYRLPVVLSADDVVCLHEGEKAVVAACKAVLPFCHTSTIGGAGNGHKSDLTPIKGKRIVIIQDNDEAGEKHTSSMLGLLHAAGAAFVGVLHLPDLPYKGDVVQWLESGGSPDEWKQRVEGVLNMEAAVEPPAVKSHLDSEIEAMAKLSAIEYDQVRKAKAKELGIRTTTLDDAVDAERKREESKKSPLNLFENVEPFDAVVDGKKLVEALAATFRRYVVLPPHADITAALWVLNTYAHDASFYSPMICLESPDKRCGKSTMMSVFSAVSCKAISVSGVTAAALFRAIDLWQPTLLIDEVDTFLNQDESLIGVINSGHNRANARVIRCDGESNEPRPFSTWSPKVLAGIGKKSHTIEDRSIIIPLKRKMAGEYSERLRLDRGNFHELKSKCQRWADDNFQAIKESDPAIPKGMNDRAADNWTPLLAIADLCALGEMARDAAQYFSMDKADDESVDCMLLKDIQGIFKATGKDKMTSKELCAHLVEIEGRPWDEWARGKPITPNRLAGRLKKFGVVSGTIRMAGSFPKGYKLESFKESFLRYLGEEGEKKRHNATTQCPPQKTAFSKRHIKDNVAFQNSQNLSQGKGCGVVAFQKGGAAEECKKNGIEDVL